MIDPPTHLLLVCKRTDAAGTMIWLALASANNCPRARPMQISDQIRNRQEKETKAGILYIGRGHRLLPFIISAQFRTVGVLFYRLVPGNTYLFIFIYWVAVKMAQPDSKKIFFENLSGAGKAIAVLTSGGDAQGRVSSYTFCGYLCEASYQWGKARKGRRYTAVS